MSKVLIYLRDQIQMHKGFIIYGLISVFVTVIDILICRLSEYFFNPVISNTLGVVTGFIIQYFLTSKYVYNTQNLRSFSVFLITFFIGLIVADGIVYFCRTLFFNGSDTMIAFLVSKGASIVFPFFLTYYLRKRFMPTDERSRGK